MITYTAATLKAEIRRVLIDVAGCAESALSPPFDGNYVRIIEAGGWAFALNIESPVLKQALLDLKNNGVFNYPH